jgi:predicted XRE-type DNA-binding protein
MTVRSSRAGRRGPASLEGSGNVFADLGVPEPEETLAEARLANLIDATLQDRGLTQTQAGGILGIDQGTFPSSSTDASTGFRRSVSSGT